MPPTLLSASIDGAIFVAIVWILSRAVRTLSPAARTMLWWAAAAKFLIALVWVTPVVVPILPVEGTPLTATIASPAVALREITSLATPGPQTGAPAPPGASSLWPMVFAGLWALGLRRVPSGRDGFDHERRTLDQEMRALDEEMRFLDNKMRELDKPMRDLDEQMRVLDREMEALDRKMQAEVKRAEAETWSVLERAVASGIAETVK